MRPARFVASPPSSRACAAAATSGAAFWTIASAAAASPTANALFASVTAPVTALMAFSAPSTSWGTGVDLMPQFFSSVGNSMSPRRAASALTFDRVMLTNTFDFAPLASVRLLFVTESYSPWYWRRSSIQFNSNPLRRPTRALASASSFDTKRLSSSARLWGSAAAISIGGVRAIVAGAMGLVPRNSVGRLTDIGDHPRPDRFDSHQVDAGHDQVASGVHEVVELFDHLAILVSAIEPVLGKPVLARREHLEGAARQPAVHVDQAGLDGVLRFAEPQAKLNVVLQQLRSVLLAGRA